MVEAWAVLPEQAQDSEPVVDLEAGSKNRKVKAAMWPVGEPAAHT